MGCDKSFEQKYPEHMRLKRISDQSQACGRFLDWLREEKGLTLAMPHQHSEGCKDADGYNLCGLRKGELFHAAVNTRRLLAEFFEIDEDRLEDEKQQMLREVDTLAEEDTERTDTKPGSDAVPIGVTQAPE